MDTKGTVTVTGTDITMIMIKGKIGLAWFLRNAIFLYITRHHANVY